MNKITNLFYRLKYRAESLTEEDVYRALSKTVNTLWAVSFVLSSLSSFAVFIARIILQVPTL